MSKTFWRSAQSYTTNDENGNKNTKIKKEYIKFNVQLISEIHSKRPHLLWGKLFAEAHHNDDHY